MAVEGHRGLDAFLGRLIRRYTAEVAAGDVEALALMQARAEQLQTAIGEAARGLVNGAGYSWADVGRVLGITRQSAHERYSGQRRRPAGELAARLRVEMAESRCHTTDQHGQRCTQVMAHGGRHYYAG